MYLLLLNIDKSLLSLLQHFSGGSVVQPGEGSPDRGLLGHIYNTTQIV